MDAETIEYLISLMPDAPLTCDGCLIEFAASRRVERNKKTFCSEDCADRNCAVMVKPTKSSVPLIDGWAV